MKVKHWGLAPYETVFQAMKDFTEQRDETTEDELWFVEHPPVFTQGMGGKPEHLLRRSDIPVVQTDRGGQITYHGPGQIVVYTLVDFSRRYRSVRDLVNRIEAAIVATLAHFGIQSAPDPKRPGVYVADEKIASLGLRICRGRAYHGLALNVDMDLTPFADINPCGYAGMHMTQMADKLPEKPDMTQVTAVLEGCLKDYLTRETIV